jgi:hypothetical protein
VRLTEISVRALKSSDTYKTFFDETLPGFGVRVGRRSRTFVAVKGRTRERVTIGHWPAMSVGDARTTAKRLLAAEPEERVVAVSFETARDAFVAHYKNPSTAYQVGRSLERHFKRLEGTRMAELPLGAIEDCLDRVRGPSERLHAFRYLRALLRWSMRPPRRWLAHSPLDGYDPPGSDRRGTRILTDQELRAVWYASPAVFRLMILWGTRNTETCVLEREWERDGVVTIPGAHTKNGRDHAVPVLPIAELVLGASESNQHVFPGHWGGHLAPGSLGKLKREVIAATGVGGWQLRDLRRTFRSNMARLGVSREVCEVLINHAPPVLDEIYDRYDRLAEKRDALRRYEHFLLWLLAQG